MNKYKNYFSTKLIFKTVFILLLLFFIKCNHNSIQNTEIEKITANKILYQDSCKIDSVQQHGTWNYNSTKSIDSIYGEYFSRTDKDYPYGITYKSAFNKNTFNKNIKVVIEAFVKSNNLDNKSGFSVSVLKKDSTLNWFMIDIQNKIKKVNEWTFISDTIVLPQTIVNGNNTFSFFLWNNGGNGTTEADDIYVKFIEIINPTLIPEIKLTNTNNDKGKQLFKNNYY